MAKVSVRHSIFETNSSSTHALSVFKIELSDAEIPEAIHIDLNSGEYGFGWEYEYYNTLWDKLAYIWLITEYMDNDEQEDARNKILAYLYAAGVQDVTIIDPKPASWGAYVDHGSEAEGFVWSLLNDTSLFYGWLFNNKSTIATGNDNDDRDVGYMDGADFKYYKSN